ncbi:hypothetical protein [Planctomicrobium sp. SH664]|uniref:hypothetical protein n=1 Tax=Planctomicrobium sp. SH664 TaxID=3448125 RepID=UPI003F5C2848
MSNLQPPEGVLKWISQVFTECDHRITQKIHNNPNLLEESLDLTWIEHLSQFSAPVRIDGAWTVKIESHFLGGLRHFYQWEIADVGVLLFVRSCGKIQLSKVALLQSKRLCPTSNRVVEEGRIDYEIGFARIADPEDLARSIAVEREFEFTEKCKEVVSQPFDDGVQAG